MRVKLDNYTKYQQISDNLYVNELKMRYNGNNNISKLTNIYTMINIMNKNNLPKNR